MTLKRQHSGDAPDSDAIVSLNKVGHGLTPNAPQTIGGLEKDADALRTELAARDDMIGEKEERIAQIKRRAQVS